MMESPRRANLIPTKPKSLLIRLAAIVVSYRQLEPVCFVLLVPTDGIEQRCRQKREYGYEQQEPRLFLL